MLSLHHDSRSDVNIGVNRRPHHCWLFLTHRSRMRTAKSDVQFFFTQNGQSSKTRYPLSDLTSPKPNCLCQSVTSVAFRYYLLHLFECHRKMFEESPTFTSALQPCYSPIAFNQREAGSKAETAESITSTLMHALYNGNHRNSLHHRCTIKHPMTW